MYSMLVRCVCIKA